MTRRVSPGAAAVGSLLILAGLTGALYWRAHEADTIPPLIVYCAASTRLPMEVIARAYEADTGRRVELRHGASEDILTKATLVNPAAPADLFLPADDSYIQIARDRGLVAEQLPIAVMRAVVLLAPGNPKHLARWADLLRADVIVTVPNPAAAVGKLTREHLAATGRWAALQPRVVDTGTVTEAANAAKLGAVDAAVVWDAVAASYPGQTVLSLPELDGVIARVEVAVLTQSADPAAARALARYITTAGLSHFRAAGFRVVDRPGAKP